VVETRLGKIKIALNLLVADFLFKINSTVPFDYSNSFLAHFVLENSKTIDCSIQISTENFTYKTAEKVFSANANFEDNYLINNYYWEVFNSENHKYFIIFEKENNKAIVKAQFSEKADNWKIFLNKDYYNNTKNIFPYPCFHLILYYFLEAQNCLMMHASGVYKLGNKAILFSGFSGAGKSTISRIFSENKYQLINDDRLVLRKIDNSWKVYNTPMFYKEKPQSASLFKLFLISHGKKNEAHKLSGASALASLLAFCLQHNYDSKIVQKNIGLVNDLLQNTAIYNLAFLPDNSVVNFIEKLDE